MVILVADHLVAFVSREPCTAEDQLWIRISGSEDRGDLLLCSAYMPQKGYTRELRVKAFDSLKATAKRFKDKGHAIAICGDLNARLGSPKDLDEERLLGRHGEPGDRTGNGKLAVSLMKEIKLSNSGGQQQPRRAAPTERSSGSRGKTQSSSHVTPSTSSLRPSSSSAKRTMSTTAPFLQTTAFWARGSVAPVTGYGDVAARHRAAGSSWSR